MNNRTPKTYAQEYRGIVFNGKCCGCVLKFYEIQNFDVEEVERVAACRRCWNLYYYNPFECEICGIFEDVHELPFCSHNLIYSLREGHRSGHFPYLRAKAIYIKATKYLNILSKYPFHYWI